MAGSRSRVQSKSTTAARPRLLVIRMTFLKRLSWLVLLQTLLVISSAGQKQKPASPEQMEPPVPKSVVKGRVVYDDNGSPVRRSPIMLLQLPERGQLTSATGRDGRFEIHDVPPGIYFVLVDSPGIITPLPFIEFSDGSPPETVDLKAAKEYCTQVAVDGTSNLDITVRARRGGAISGKVTYSDGSPAVNAVLAVMRKKGNQTTRVLTGMNGAALLSFQTDDRGRYRISGLPPGEYVVSATEKNTIPERSGRRDPFSDMMSSDALELSYYGNSTRLADATSLRLDLGSELNNIDITLSDATPHLISGSVVSKTGGRPLPTCTLNIRNKEQGNWFPRGQRQILTDSDGRWWIEGVPDGNYTISVDPPYEPPFEPSAPGEDQEPKPRKRNSQRFLPKETEITVAGSDLAGVAIELAEGASVSGTVEVPQGPESETGYLIVKYVYEGQADKSYGNEVMVRNGTFMIEPLRPGKIYLTSGGSSMGVGAPSKYYVKSITLNGVDLTQKPLTVENGQAVTNVRIVLGSDLGQAKVQVVDSAGKPFPAKSLLIVSANPSQWSFVSQSFNEVTDVNGMVSFSGAPGEYLVIVAGADDSWPPNLEAIGARAETARRIKILPGDNKMITVTVNR